MMTDGTQKEFESIAAYTAQFGISEQTCRELYDKHRHYTPANIKAACSILDACISHIYHQRMLEVRSLDTAQQIEKIHQRQHRLGPVHRAPVRALFHLPRGAVSAVPHELQCLRR